MTDDDDDYQLSISRECELAKDIADALLKKAVSATLTRHNVTRAQISIALVDDARIASINESFLQLAGPTDVITFDLRDDPPANSNESSSPSDKLSPAQANDDRAGDIDGEIVISVETALRESVQRGHSLEAEVALYAVHGALHLLDYDDQTEEEAQRMHAMEDVILATVGVGTVYGKPKT